jgi:hypothetical protein
MKTIASVLAILFVVGRGWCADVYVEKAPPHKHCSLRGGASAKSKKAAENILKNRWRSPVPADFDARVTTQALSAPGNDRTRWSNQHAARIRGYVVSAEANTGGELCNCGSTKSIDCDTHIAIVADSATANDRRTYVFVEVTPRIREILAAQNPSIDWTSEALHKRLPGHRVEFQGWMFFDSGHSGQATNTHPNDPKHANRRATCWEIHSVTSIQGSGTLLIPNMEGGGG